MHLSDRTTGLILVGVGALAIYGGSRLPPMPGQEIGPSVFPMLIGSGLALCGALIVFGIGRTYEAAAEAELASLHGEVRDTPPSRFYGLRALVPIALLLFYVVASERIGFVPVAIIIIATMARSLGAKLRHAVLLALVMAPIIHLLFSKLLRVPLPDGLLPMPW